MFSYTGSSEVFTSGLLDGKAHLLHRVLYWCLLTSNLIPIPSASSDRRDVFSVRLFTAPHLGLWIYFWCYTEVLVAVLCTCDSLSFGFYLLFTNILLILSRFHPSLYWWGVSLDLTSLLIKFDIFALTSDIYPPFRRGIISVMIRYLSLHREWPLLVHLFYSFIE